METSRRATGTRAQGAETGPSEPAEPGGRHPAPAPPPLPARAVGGRLRSLPGSRVLGFTGRQSQHLSHGAPRKWPITETHIPAVKREPNCVLGSQGSATRGRPGAAFRGAPYPDVFGGRPDGAAHRVGWAEQASRGRSEAVRAAESPPGVALCCLPTRGGPVTPPADTVPSRLRGDASAALSGAVPRTELKHTREAVSQVHGKRSVRVSGR